jgi:hypothetical protein
MQALLLFNFRQFSSATKETPYPLAIASHSYLLFPALETTTLFFDSMNLLF